MELKPAASRMSATGPADWFTGQVWLDELGALPSAGIRALRVTFSPGARTAWHAHPGGHVLHVMGGAGLVQAAGGPQDGGDAAGGLGGRPGGSSRLVIQPGRTVPGGGLPDARRS